MKIVTLSESEKSLVKMWHKEFIGIKRQIDSLINEALTHKLEMLAKEKGIDVVRENWKFDNVSMVFTSDSEILDAEVIPDEEPAAPLEDK